MERVVLFIGNTGVGKSFVCNKIFHLLGSTRRFESSDRVTSVTSTLQQGEVNFQRKKYTIIDAPGFFDVNRNVEETAKTDGDNVCKLVSTLERSEEICAIVFLFESRLSFPHQMWFNRMVDIIGRRHLGQVILLKNKSGWDADEVQQKVNVITNGKESAAMLGVENLCYFEFPNAGMAGEEVLSKLTDQLMAKISSFVPFTVKNLKIPEIAYEGEVEEIVEREISKDKFDPGRTVTETKDKSYTTEKMVSTMGGLMKTFYDPMVKVTEYVERMVEEVKHVPDERTEIAMGRYKRVYKVRFDGTKDFKEEVLLEQWTNTYGSC